MPGRWVVVVPVKDATTAKTRLGGALDERSRIALARAMALDTIAAAATCPAVALVVVVTSDEAVDREAPAVGATVRVVPEPSHVGQRSGLDAAAATGVATARALASPAPVGVLLGDLPALLSDDLAEALAAAEGRERATVPDAEGTGTTLLTVADGVAFDSRFGVGSAAAHVALGYVRLDIAEDSSLRHDVDLPVDLERVRAMHPGPRTARLLDRLMTSGERGVRRDRLGRPASDGDDDRAASVRATRPDATA